VNSVTLVIQVGGFVDVSLTLKEGSVGGAGEELWGRCPSLGMCTRPSSKVSFVQSTLQRRRSYNNERTESNDTSSVENNPSIAISSAKTCEQETMGWLEMELVLSAQVYISSFRLSPRFFFSPSSLFSPMCTFLASGFRFRS